MTRSKTLRDVAGDDWREYAQARRVEHMVAGRFIQAMRWQHARPSDRLLVLEGGRSDD